MCATHTGVWVCARMHACMHACTHAPTHARMWLDQTTQITLNTLNMAFFANDFKGLAVKGWLFLLSTPALNTLNTRRLVRPISQTNSQTWCVMVANSATSVFAHRSCVFYVKSGKRNHFRTLNRMFAR